ncbi:MAG: hypothetical protein IPH20_18930 [Bacteroidales bacterium]|nr:hypothetical protein [Bacteroidales bacterium]
MPANYGTQSGTAALYSDGSNGSSAWNTLQCNELTMFAGSTMNDLAPLLHQEIYCPLGII